MPEEVTDAHDRVESLAMAEDALARALAGNVHSRREIPLPGAARVNQATVAVPTVVAEKVALHSAMRVRCATKAASTERLGASEAAIGT